MPVETEPTLWEPPTMVGLTGATQVIQSESELGLGPKPQVRHEEWQTQPGITRKEPSKHIRKIESAGGGGGNGDAGVRSVARLKPSSALAALACALKVAAWPVTPAPVACSVASHESELMFSLHH